MKSIRLAVSIWLSTLLACLAGTWAYAQSAAIPESLQPMASPLATIIRTDGAWADRRQVPNVDQYEFDFTAMGGLNLRQSYRQSIVKRSNALLQTGLEENVENTLSLELTPRTALAFSHETKTVRDLQQALLTGTKTNTLGLTQGFGSGHSSGLLKFQQIENNTFSGTAEAQELLTRIIGLETGLGKRYSLTAELTKTDSPEVIGFHSRKTEASLALPFSGGEGKLAYSQLTEAQDIHHKQVKTMELVAPLALFGGQAKTEFYQNFATKDGQETKERTFKFFTPLESLRSGATFSYASEPVHRKDKPTQQVRSTMLTTPLGFLGTTGTLELRRGGINEPERQEQQRAAHLTAQVQGNTMSLWSKTRRIDTNGTAQTIREFILDTPELSLLNDQTKLEYHLHLTDNNGQKSQVPRMAFSTALAFLDDEALLTSTIEQVARKDKPTQEVRATDFRIPLSLWGSGAKFEQSRVTLREPGQREVRHRSYLAAAMSNEKQLTLEYSICKAQTDDGTVLFKQPRMALFAPLDFLHSEATLTHRIEQIARKDKPIQEVRSTELMVPFAIMGSAARLEQNQVTLQEPGKRQISYRTYLSVPLSSEKLELERYAINTPTGDGINRERKFSIQTPKFELFTDYAGIKAKHVITEYSAQPTVRITTLDITAQPLKRLDLAANYQIWDKGAGQDSRFRKLHGRWKLGKSLALNGRFEQSNATDNAATTLRHIYLTKDRNGDHSLGIQVGYTTWGGSDRNWDPATRVQFAWGNPRKLGINLQYTEYEDKEWQRLDQSIVKLALLHGNPDSLKIKFEYENQPQQKSQNRQAHLSLPMFGGDMQIGYVRDPLDRFGKQILSGRRYDFGYARNIFGSVSLDIGYRYGKFSQQVLPEELVQYLKLQIVGGDENRGGQIDLGYRSGDFVPQPDPKKAVPRAILDLRYTKHWGDRGRLVITLHRITPPSDSQDIKKSTEGRLEYSAAF